MVLAIGLVVDDAIVMLENVHRHIEMGKKLLDAAIDGAREIGFATAGQSANVSSWINTTGRPILANAASIRPWSINGLFHASAISGRRVSTVSGFICWPMPKMPPTTGKDCKRGGK